MSDDPFASLQRWQEEIAWHDPVTDVAYSYNASPDRKVDVWKLDRHIGNTELYWGRRKVTAVSTVHLVVPHPYYGDERMTVDAVWETMVFGASPPDVEDWFDLQGRYRTLEDALEGHRVFVLVLTKGLTMLGHTVVRHENPCPLLELRAAHRRELEAAND